VCVCVREREREREALQNRVTECNLKLAGERGNDSERERGED